LQTTATFKQIKKVKDDRFEEENIHDYTLLVNVGPRDLQLAVLDSADNRILYLEDCVFPAVSSPDDLVATLEDLLEHHAFLKAGFWNAIKIAVKNQKLIQVPQDYFIADDPAKYLKFNAPVSQSRDEVYYVNMKESQAVTVFALQSEIRNLFERTYPQRQLTFTHQSVGLIEGVMRDASTRSDNPLYLYVDRFKLHLLSATGNKLVYYNQFSIHNFQDYVKYIMLVMKTLGMEQETTPIVLWGYLGNNSPHYQEFCKYVRHVTFGKRPDHLKFGYPFDEVQDHHYFDLYNINLS
jgi:hypothetical protein